MSKSDNQPRYIRDVSFITESFRGGDDVNPYIFLIARYMNEHLEELDDTHSILFIHLEILKNHLLDRIEGCDPKSGVAEEMSSLEVNNYIISLILSVLDNPASLEKDRMALLYAMRACIYAIGSKNTHSLDDLRAELARLELIEKEIILSLGN